MVFSQINIVVPVYRNRETLLDLYRQILDVTQVENTRIQFIFVDDACPDSSCEVLEFVDPQRITIIHQPINTGQQSAIRRGLKECINGPVVVMDADLQDPPEAIPMLLAQLCEGHDAVFAARKGEYQSGLRMHTGRLFRALLRAIVPLPKGAGAYAALSAPLVKRLNKSQNPRFYLAGMIGCHANNIGAIKVGRRTREIGKSTYSGAMRLATGISNIKCVLYEKSQNGNVTVRSRRT